MARAIEDIFCSDRTLANIRGDFSGTRSCSTCECGICLENITEECIILDCGHPFHKECIKQWFQTSPDGYKCSTCKQQVQTKDVETIYGRKVDERRELEAKQSNFWQSMFSGSMYSGSGSSESLIDVSWAFPGIESMQEPFETFEDFAYAFRRLPTDEESKFRVYERFSGMRMPERLLNWMFEKDEIRLYRERIYQTQKESMVKHLEEKKESIFDLIDTFARSPENLRMTTRQAIAKFMKENKDTGKLNVRTFNGGNLLHYLVEKIGGNPGFNNESGLLNFFVKEGKQDLNLKNRDGKTPLDIAIEKGGPARIIETLTSLSSSGPTTISKFFSMYFC